MTGHIFRTFHSTYDSRIVIFYHFTYVSKYLQFLFFHSSVCKQLLYYMYSTPYLNEPYSIRQGSQPLGHGLVLVSGILGARPPGRWMAGEWAKLHLILTTSPHYLHSPPWKNCLLQNWSLVLKSLGTTATWRKQDQKITECMCSCFSHVRLFVTLWIVVRHAPLFMRFSRQESWSGLPFPPPGDLPHPGEEYL